MSNEISSQNSVIAVSFANEEDAYGALTKLKELAAAIQIVLSDWWSSRRSKPVETTVVSNSPARAPDASAALP